MEVLDRQDVNVMKTTACLSYVSEYIAVEMKRPALHVLDPEVFNIAVNRLGHKNFLELVRVLNNCKIGLFYPVDPKEPLVEYKNEFVLPNTDPSAPYWDHPPYRCSDVISKRQANEKKDKPHILPRARMKPPRCRSSH